MISWYSLNKICLYTKLEEIPRKVKCLHLISDPVKKYLILPKKNRLFSAVPGFPLVFSN